MAIFKREYFVAREWVLQPAQSEKDWFELDNATFLSKEHIGDALPEYCSIYTFCDDGTIKYNLITKVGFCGIGVLFLDKSEWDEKDGILTLKLRGGRRAISKFEYVSTYSIEELTEERLSIKRLKKLKESVKSFG